MYRDDLAALTARHDALEHEVAHKTRELEHAGRLLEQAKERMRLPVLDNLRVASPCSADWSKMTGDERARHCDACDKTVYNLSGMTRDEAEALILAKEGRLCVRYYQRADGTILLADCTIGKKRARRRWLVAAGAAGLLGAGGAIATGRAPHTQERDEIVMGRWSAGVLPVTPDPGPPDQTSPDDWWQRQSGQPADRSGR